MRLVSKELDPADRKRIGLRIHPEVKRQLKAAAALAGETMEDHLHRILVQQLGGLDPAPQGERPRSNRATAPP